MLERFQDQHVERSVNEVRFLFRHKNLSSLDSLGVRLFNLFPRLSRGDCARYHCRYFLMPSRLRMIVTLVADRALLEVHLEVASPDREARFAPAAHSPNTPLPSPP